MKRKRGRKRKDLWRAVSALALALAFLCLLAHILLVSAMSSEEGPNSGASWELSKENIQPLKGGRRAAALLATPQGSAQGRPGALSLAPSAEKQKEIREAKR